ncbi:hypothetical protein [Pseudoalteromonas rhizosphaerae]|uniref:Uncharacterized protein n=1 Tax=Pseudoalteromonas rhizosphaerae TaxID=2518973 RepID=A0ABW8KUM6_9GAMM
MNISNLINRVGDENVMYQSVQGSLVGVKDKKREGDTEVTIATTQINANDVACNTGKVGIIVWINRDSYEKALNKSEQ